MFRLLLLACGSVQQIVSKSKKILEDEKKAKKQNGPPKAITRRKTRCDIGVSLSKKGNRRTTWTEDEDRAVKKIYK